MSVESDAVYLDLKVIKESQRATEKLLRNILNRITSCQLRGLLSDYTFYYTIIIRYYDSHRGICQCKFDGSVSKMRSIVKTI